MKYSYLIIAHYCWIYRELNDLSHGLPIKCVGRRNVQSDYIPEATEM